jgi:hypothetical protein
MAKKKVDDNGDLIHIGTINSPNGGTRPWFVTKDIKAKMDAHPFKPETDFTRCVLATYTTLLDEMLEGLTPNTPEYEERRKQVVAWIKAKIEEEEQQEKNEG